MSPDVAKPAGAPRLALFEYGFRPFFLLVALAAAASILAWLGLFFGRVTLPSGWPGVLWHGHEMVFGFAGAGVGGFMLTAVPNWTGAAPVRGARLALLAATWLAGRVALCCAALLPGVLVAVLDLAFLPLLALLVTPPLIAKARESGPRNLVFLVLLAALETANLLTHLEALGATGATALPGLHLGLFVLALMVTMVGGRIVPTFTTNALRRAGATRLPRSHPALDAVAILAVAATAALGLAPATAALGIAALVAALANALRLWLWRPLATLGEPILWVLHLGYLWLVVGLALVAAGAFGLAPPSAGIHALAVGAVGTMLLAVMTRASLGHTGRALVAPHAAIIGYALVSLAALLRIAATLPSGFEPPLIALSGLLFAAAFLLFGVWFAPVLLLARPDGKPG